MNFDKENFSKILTKIKDSYGSINQMADKTGITAAYISKLIRQMYYNSPSPEILKKIADNSNGIASYDDLMTVCGYINYDFDRMLTSEYELQFHNFNQKLDILDFSNYEKKLLFDFFSTRNIRIYDDVPPETIRKFSLAIMYFLREIGYPDKYNFDNTNIEVIDPEAIETALKTTSDNSLKSYLEKVLKWAKYKDSQYYMCPVYGQISAGQPNWAEECIEGRLPIDPNLMGIIDPEECYFLRVNGESMNKVVDNGAYALIRKTDWVENGEIAVVLVNGFDATLKKFSKQGDLVVLEPMSNDNSFQVQIYDKNTPVEVIGKYIGKFEMKQ